MGEIFHGMRKKPLWECLEALCFRWPPTPVSPGRHKRYCGRVEKLSATSRAIRLPLCRKAGVTRPPRHPGLERGHKGALAGSPSCRALVVLRSACACLIMNISAGLSSRSGQKIYMRNSVLLLLPIALSSIECKKELSQQWHERFSPHSVQREQQTLVT